MVMTRNRCISLGKEPSQGLYMVKTHYIPNNMKNNGESFSQMKDERYTILKELNNHDMCYTIIINKYRNILDSQRNLHKTILIFHMIIHTISFLLFVFCLSAIIECGGGTKVVLNQIYNEFICDGTDYFISSILAGGRAILAGGQAVAGLRLYLSCEVP